MAHTADHDEHLPAIPVIDLQRWRDGDPSVAATVDDALRTVGFVMLAGHGVDQGLIDGTRSAGYAFFHGPDEAKASVAVTPDAYRGWVGSGTQSNAATYGIETLPDLKESYIVGPTAPADVELSPAGEQWFLPNRWPAAPADLRTWTERYHAAMAGLAEEVLTLFAEALGLEADALTSFCATPTSSINLNWYPSHTVTPSAPVGQFRVGPHTDFGTITLLDREPGAGGLQVQRLDGEWVDAPWVPGTFTVNIGDLMSHWTNGRWRSTRHRVLPPPIDVPSEELLSLVFFHGADHDAVVVPFDVGGSGVVDRSPVLAGEYVAAKVAALAVD
ncbi:isopenicillin N synthase family dioxygenase [Ilumatobacter coccineus]|uniref:Putative oxidoreductase n=1 Tax=Ilumatobacter coccineus (strain NBRC 103263 / KCTC 29153 / YM16-304) TaxID=1313172 RepID=A0A6C7E8J7_ILUCY|nr:2-oxoglutarate and iron-dependent oxygenase domain-containing protein [Ilumatobacter coccineus]BAN00918.1 putative oxidoreductase [Ilumatobacter coccineus YM16-304]